LLLNDAVLQLLLQSEVRSKAVIENAVPRAQDGLRCLVFSISAQAPGNANSRSKIGVVSKIVLRFITQARAQCEVGPEPPIILQKERAIKPGYLCLCCS